MCEECRQTPHATTCPNADEPKQVGVCIFCKDEIHEGQKHYTTIYEHIQKIICKDCLEVIN